jgi:uncharacterized membrane protein YgcG
MLLKDYKINFFNSLKNIQEEQEIESFFFILTEYLHNLKRVDVALNPNFELKDAEVDKWNTILEQLQQEKPIQYITGEAWFYGLRFEVNENTLIPRPETEELVEWILNSPITQHPSPINILDIGTGTGCIPISLKANLSQTNVSAIEADEDVVIPDSVYIKDSDEEDDIDGKEDKFSKLFPDLFGEKINIDICMGFGEGGNGEEGGSGEGEEGGSGEGDCSGEGGSSREG